MKKKLLLCMIFTIVHLKVFSETIPFGKKFLYPFERGSLIVNRNMLTIDGKHEKGSFSADNFHMKFKTPSKTYFILYCKFEDCEFLTLLNTIDKKNYEYEAWTMPYSLFDNNSFSAYPVLKGFQVIHADSFVTEKNSKGKTVKFIPENFFDATENPWAVNKNAYSKKIYIKADKWRNKGFRYAPINHIVIINGFVNPEKDYLYEQNARAKNIKISYGETSETYLLKDNGNYQVLALPKAINVMENIQIEIEVLDQYNGTKYDDIVISGILYLDTILK